MKNSSDCPGKGKCHGPANWCDRCGDVYRICDSPGCHAHSTVEQLEKVAKNAREEWQELHRKATDAMLALRDAEHDLELAKQWPHRHAGVKP